MANASCVCVCVSVCADPLRQRPCAQLPIFWGKNGISERSTAQVSRAVLVLAKDAANAFAAAHDRSAAHLFRHAGATLPFSHSGANCRKGFWCFIRGLLTTSPTFTSSPSSLLKPLPFFTLFPFKPFHIHFQFAPSPSGRGVSEMSLRGLRGFSGARRVWAPKGGGGPTFRVFFLLPATIIILSRFSHDSPGAQTCTFQGGGLEKHHERTPKRGKKE